MERARDADLRPVLAALRDDAGLADAVADALARDLPAVYDRPRTGAFGRGLARGTAVAVQATARRLEDAEAGTTAQEREHWRQLGREELRDGRDAAASAHALLVVARALWTRLAPAVGGDDEAQRALGDAILRTAGDAVREVLAGHAEEQGAGAAERGLARRALVSALLRPSPPSAASLQATARATGWRATAEVAVLVAEGEDGERLAGAIGPEALGATVDEQACVVLADPRAPGLDGRLDALLRERRAGLGPPAPLDAARGSYALARRALALGRAGLVRADDDLPALAAHAEPALARRLAARTLAPLEDLDAATRERLEITLRSWLRHQGRALDVAAELHLHPQSVRHRIRRARALLGDALDDPDQRFALELALRGGVGRS